MSKPPSSTSGGASPARQDLPITLGVEEELFLVDPGSRDLLADPNAGIFETCERTCGPHKVVREFLRSQIETNTRVCGSVSELRTALRETRQIVIEAAEQYGAAVMAASAHPFASWRAQAITPKERYKRFAVTFQEGIRQFVISGMHIHAGLRRRGHAYPGDDGATTLSAAAPRAVDLVAIQRRTRDGVQVLPAEPDRWPAAHRHAGPLRSWEEYDRLLSGYQRMKFLNDGSELWWDIRPSHAYPTVELRICDVCTRIEDAVSIAALYACLIRWLWRQDREGQLPPEPLTELIAEDRWIAQRYGVFAFFGDRTSSTGRVDIADYLSELVDELATDARALGCEARSPHPGRRDERHRRRPPDRPLPAAPP